LTMKIVSFSVGDKTWFLSPFLFQLTIPPFYQLLHLDFEFKPFLTTFNLTMTYHSIT